MKFIHISDLHLGKTIYGVNLIDSLDQPVWVDRFLTLADQVRPDAVVIAGDVYDRAAPSEDAVKLLSRLLTSLAEKDIAVLVSCGNHDSGKRLSFASDLLSRQRVHIAGELGANGAIPRVTLSDEFGPVHFYLMPYVFPLMASEALGVSEGFTTYDSAVKALIKAQDIDESARNVILAHQFVTANGGEVQRGGSESMVAGVGQVDYTAFDPFEYAALGHIHRAYCVGREQVRYAGSPLCYHFDESEQAPKGPLLVELGAKGAEVKIDRLDIEPLHKMRTIRGAADALKQSETAHTGRDEYVRVTTTDGYLSPSDRAFFTALLEGRDSRLLDTGADLSRRSMGDGEAMEAARTAEDISVEDRFAQFCAYVLKDEALSNDQRRLITFVGELTRNAPDVHLDPTDAQIDKLLSSLIREEVRA